MRGLPARSKDQMKTFGGETPYSVMFGPDICGFSTQKARCLIMRSCAGSGAVSHRACDLVHAEARSSNQYQTVLHEKPRIESAAE